MPTEEQLAPIVRRANDALEEMQNLLGNEFPVYGRIKFPRNYLTANSVQRGKLFSGLDAAIASNISYAMMMGEIFKWILFRTDLTLVAREMVIKEYVCLAASICETLTKKFLYGDGSNLGFADRAGRLVERAVIDAQLKDELLWLWEIRVKDHIWECPTSEFDQYDDSNISRADAALTNLLGKLVEQRDTYQGS